MTTPDDPFAFAPPPFKADEALLGLERKLRDMKLVKRGGKEFVLAGRAVAEVSSDGAAIQTRVVKRPAVTPQWANVQTLKSAADVRTFTDTLARQMKRWADED